MKNLLFIDTETTGLPLNYSLDYSNVNNWPRLVQIAWSLYSEEGALLETGNFIIKPEGFTIPQKAVEIHKIDNEKAINEGVELIIVLFKFLEVLSKSNILIGHNINFDEKVVGCELFRKHFDTSKLSLITKFCSMRDEKVIEFCNLNGKRPTLNELYSKLFGENITNTHNALSDVIATSECYFELVERGIIEISKKNISKINTLKSVQTNIVLTNRYSTDGIKKQIDEIPIVNKLTQVFKFENRQNINSNKKSDYDYWDGDNFDYDDEGFDDYMRERIRDDEENDFLEKEELENNIDLKQQLDELSLNWRNRFNEIVIFNDNISIGKQVNKYFFLNGYTGESLSKDFFELISVINNNTVIVKKDGKFGMMDSLLQEILPLNYSQIINYDNIFFVLLRFDTSKNIIIGSSNTRYKLYHINRFFILDSEYQEISYFNHGLFKIKNIKTIATDKYGLINVRGELLLQNDYLTFNNLDSCCPEYFIGTGYNSLTLFRFNIEKNTVEKIIGIDADRAYFKKMGENGDFILQVNKRDSDGLILIDVYGKKCTYSIYKEIEYLQNEELIKVCENSRYYGKLYGLLDYNFTKILPCKFSDIAPFLNEKSIVKIDDKFQIINLKGELITDEKFIFASHVKNGWIAFVNGNIDVIKIGIIFKDDMRINKLTLGLIDKDGKIFLQYKWDKITFGVIFNEIDCDELLIYILNILKESVNQYISFDENCYTYTKYTEQMLLSDFNVKYNEIDQHIKEIKAGNANEVKLRIFYFLV